jgi:integrase
MAIFKKKGSKFFYVRFSFKGHRVDESTKTVSRAEAQRYEDKRRAELRNNAMFGTKPKKTWAEAVIRWCEESQEKRTILQDIQRFQNLDAIPLFQNIYLEDISRDLIDQFISYRDDIGAGKVSTNRYLALIRSVLNKAYKDWEWIEKIPTIRLRFGVEKSRDRYLSFAEYRRLQKELPDHLKPIIELLVLTGQRKSNIVKLKWEWVDFEKKLIVIPKEEFKTNKEHIIPMSQKVIDIIKIQAGKHPIYVFTYKGEPLQDIHNSAWIKALSRAGISNLRIHDLRHTWATWLGDKGVPADIIQDLGGWTSHIMVRRYSHRSVEKLRRYAELLETV